MGRRVAHRLWRRVGKRGTVLLFCALLDEVYAYSLIDQPAIVRRSYELIMPWQAWAVLWGSVGLLCLAQAFTLRDRIAFGAAAAIKWAWGTTALVAWLAGEFPRGWLAAMVWIAFGAMISTISTWTEEWDRP